MSETFTQWANEPRYVTGTPGAFANIWRWYRLIYVTDAKKIRLSIYHRGAEAAYWGEISHEYATPYSGWVRYFIGDNSVQESAVAAAYGLPHPLVDPGERDILFLEWEDAGELEYWGNIQAPTRLQNIYVSRKGSTPDPYDPGWSGAVPIKGRYPFFVFAYTRGNELPSAGDTEVFGTVFDGAGEKAGVIVSAKRV
mgnify:FL=1